MPRFYFDIHENGVADRDDDGFDLQDISVAREQAILAIKDSVADKVTESALIDLSTAYVEIRDDEGRVVETVRYRDALGMSWPPPVFTA